MMRADRHPGKLSKMQKKVRKDISADENAVDTAIDEVRVISE